MVTYNLGRCSDNSTWAGAFFQGVKVLVSGGPEGQQGQWCADFLCEGLGRWSLAVGCTRGSVLPSPPVEGR